MSGALEGLRIAFIGGGIMGEAIIRGLLKVGAAVPEQIIVSDPVPERVSALREYVRTIDHDPRFELRPPFEATLEFRQGVASDIQAFGVEGARPAATADPWYYFRQDLYLDARGAPFLVLHWKHALDSIRMLDVIPGDGTRQVEA